MRKTNHEAKLAKIETAIARWQKRSFQALAGVRYIDELERTQARAFKFTDKRKANE